MLALGFNPAQDVQVLCPMTQAETGTRNLNQVLQLLVNPPHPDKTEFARGNSVLRVGKRVIQKVNDYNREVFGDLGVVEGFDLEEQETTVRFKNCSVTYDLADFNEIGLACAVTIHKSPDSEYPVVIMPIFL